MSIIIDNKNETEKRVRPGVKALIVHNGKILMIREKIGDLVISDFPGGGIEYGESFEETVKREVFEEVGLKIEMGKLVGSWWFINSEKVHIVCLGYQCSLMGSEIIDVSKNPANEQIFEAKWYSKNEILENSDVMLKKSHGMLEAVRNLEI